MNLQTLISSLTKKKGSPSKEVLVVVDNKEYELAVVSHSPDKIVITTVAKEDEGTLSKLVSKLGKSTKKKKDEE